MENDSVATARFLTQMRIWIDLANSPHVPFFRALIPEFVARTHQVEITARDFAQTVELATKAGMMPHVIGGHGGGRLAGKAGNLIGRAAALRRWARDRGFDLAVSHNSYAQISAAAALGIKTVTLMDYEHQPANHLAFRLASRVIVPRAFPASELRKYGASTRKVRRYDGLKEDVYLADFNPDPKFAQALRKLGVAGEDVLVVARPPAREALYHRFENELFDDLLTRLSSRSQVKIILLPRSDAQRAEYERRKVSNVIMPREALDGADLIAAADLVVSAGGTMNREAATLGVPAASVYAGKWAAIDEELVREGRLQRLASRDDLDSLTIAKKKGRNPRNAKGARAAVVKLILD
jgi:predicted glycosyltransferase